MVEKMASSSSNPAFAFVVNSLLNSNKNAKLLSKAKKESDVKFDANSKKLPQVIEIVNDDGVVVEEILNSTNDDTKKNNVTNNPGKITKIRKIDVELVGRVKPNPSERNYERRLSSIATKGVVQLFNVVKEQQKSIGNKLREAGTSGQKRAKALSEFTEDKFIQRVNEKKAKTESSATGKNDKNAVTKKKNFLSESFMAGDKFKNWDVESDEDDDNEI